MHEKKDTLISLLPASYPNVTQQLQIDRKYGMFIHFGINTFNDTEWSDGSLPLESYTPPVIDADGWVKNAYAAGMNYVILITKHHDGFCLFHTEYTDYCVKNTSNTTDVVAAVAEACKKYGVQLGLYYSLWDRHETCYHQDGAYVQYMCNQLTELLDGRYGDICEMWFDGAWDKAEECWQIPVLYDLVHRLQPKCSVSTNLTIGETGGEKWQNKYKPKRYKAGMPIRYFPSDFRLWDPHFTKKGNRDPKIYTFENNAYYLPFEATICIRNMRNWFWDPKYTQDRLLSTGFIVRKYKHLTRQNNVLIVNVAPNIYGRQEPSDIARLMEVADKLGIARRAEKS